MASGDAALMRLEIAGSIPAMGGAGYSPDMVKQSFVGKSKELTLEVFSLRTIGAVPKANFNIATLVDMEYQQLWS